LNPHPCSHVQHGSCGEQAIKKSHLTRDSRSAAAGSTWQRSVGCVGTFALQSNCPSVAHEGALRLTFILLTSLVDLH